VIPNPNNLPNRSEKQLLQKRKCPKQDEWFSLGEEEMKSSLGEKWPREKRFSSKKALFKKKKTFADALTLGEGEIERQIRPPLGIWIRTWNPFGRVGGGALAGRTSRAGENC